MGMLNEEQFNALCSHSASNPNNPSHLSGQIRADIAISLNNALFQSFTKEDMAESSPHTTLHTQLIDVKTLGLGNAYRNQAKRMHLFKIPIQRCVPVNERGDNVHGEYVTKARRADSILRNAHVLSESDQNPILNNLKRYPKVKGLVVGFFGEISNHFRQIIEAIVDQETQNRLQYFVAGNVSRAMTRTWVYNQIRNRFGVLLHQLWFTIMANTLEQAEFPREIQSSANLNSRNDSTFFDVPFLEDLTSLDDENGV